MALQVSTEDERTGVVAPKAYWYVAGHRAEYVSGGPAPDVHVALRAYRDVAARDDGREPFVALDAWIPGSTLVTIMATQSYSDLRAAIYDWLKANVGRFDGASDV